MEFPVGFLADDEIKPKWNTSEGQPLFPFALDDHTLCFSRYRAALAVDVNVRTLRAGVLFRPSPNMHRHLSFPPCFASMTRQNTFLLSYK